MNHHHHFVFENFLFLKITTTVFFLFCNHRSKMTPSSTNYGIMVGWQAGWHQCFFLFDFFSKVRTEQNRNSFLPRETNCRRKTKWRSPIHRIYMLCLCLFCVKNVLFFLFSRFMSFYIHNSSVELARNSIVFSFYIDFFLFSFFCFLFSI